MLARILDPETEALVLVCGPHWDHRCGAAGEKAEIVFCAGQTVLVDRPTPDGVRLLRVKVAEDQRTCPFARPEPAAAR